MDKSKQKQIERALTRLCTEGGGRLTAEAVLREAEDPASPLHSEFEWDDGEAARLYRLNQARTLIKTVRVEVRTDTRVLSAPVYVRDPSANRNEQGYVQAATLRTERGLALEALRSEFDQLSARADRLLAIAKTVGLEAEGEDLLSRLGHFRRILDEAA